MKAVAAGMAIWGHLGRPGRVKAARSSLPLVERLLATSLFPSSAMFQQHAASNVSLIEPSSAR
jgi:hypothetical protein